MWTTCWRLVPVNLQEHSKDMTMRWGVPWSFLESRVTRLCKDFGFGELKGSNTLSFEKLDANDTVLTRIWTTTSQTVAWKVTLVGSS